MGEAYSYYIRQVAANKQSVSLQSVEKERLHEWVKGKTYNKTGPEIIKLFSCLTQLSMNFFLLINVQMLTNVCILTCMSGENSILGLSES